jgi:replicative DNA helicase
MPAFIDAELEDDVISAIAADPSWYWAVRERFPATASDVFAARRGAWDELARAIETGTAPDLAHTATPSADPLHAAERLVELYWRRTLARLAEETQQDLLAARPARQVAEVLAAELADLHDSMLPQHASSLSWGDGLLQGITDELTAASAARAAGRRTTGLASSGLPSLDLALNGWQPGALYILGGAPGVGKTSLALQWACDAVAERDVVVVYVTYENSPKNLAFKAIGRLGGVSPSAVERGRADPARWNEGVERFRAIASRLALVPADAGTSVNFVESVTREALAHRAGPGLVIVDYLQRMAYAERFGTLQDNVSALAQRLRDLAVRLDLPVLAISALGQGGEDLPLRLSSLAERGELEYASDVVLLLGPRADVALASASRARATPGMRLLELQVAKNRYGEANRSIPLMFRPATGEFQEESLV